MFYATLMEVLCVDVFIPDDLKIRLASYGKLSERITLINRSSLEQETLNQIKSLLGECRATMILLDSYHTHDHVLQELQLYSPLVGKGFYLICGVTIIEDIPEQKHRSHPWGPGNNPKRLYVNFSQKTTDLK